MIKRMKELVEILNKAAEVYYQGRDEIMSNYEYDKLYDELELLEKETGIVLAGSVTQKIGYEIQSKLPKVTHSSRMMSLDKTKDVQNLVGVIKDHEGMLSWKLDGLTVVAEYKDGKIVSAVTRGNGQVGEDVTNNYKNFTNVPLTIENKDHIVVRGEAVISYKTFEEINSRITNIEDKYKNPRNLCSGSVRQLDPNETKKRGVEFIVFEVVKGLNETTRTGKLESLRNNGFDIVEYYKVNTNNLEEHVEKFKSKIEANKYPTDGLVLAIDDIEVGSKLGSTSKFPKHSKAFKWQDEIAESRLLYIDWSVSRNGVITPVAVFEPVDIDGSTVERASLHNISILEEILGGRPYKGQKVWVIRSNMVIPQIVRSDKDNQ